LVLLCALGPTPVATPVPQGFHGLARVRTCIERVFAAACTGGACECLTERQFVKEIGSVREVALRVFFFVGTKTNIRVSPPPPPRAHTHAVDTSACCASRRSFAAVKMLGQSCAPLLFDFASFWQCYSVVHERMRVSVDRASRMLACLSLSSCVDQTPCLQTLRSIRNLVAKHSRACM
jgi:hypothetical protein